MNLSQLCIKCYYEIFYLSWNSELSDCDTDLVIWGSDLDFDQKKFKHPMTHRRQMLHITLKYKIQNTWRGEKAKVTDLRERVTSLKW